MMLWEWWGDLLRRYVIQTHGMILRSCFRTILFSISLSFRSTVSRAGTSRDGFGDMNLFQLNMMTMYRWYQYWTSRTWTGTPVFLTTYISFLHAAKSACLITYKWNIKFNRDVSLAITALGTPARSLPQICSSQNSNELHITYMPRISTQITVNGRYQIGKNARTNYSRSGVLRVVLTHVLCQLG